VDELNDDDDDVSHGKKMQKSQQICSVVCLLVLLDTHAQYSGN